jgi:metal-responsive CopG/Arc/MetJ family transcriptional regulator
MPTQKVALTMPPHFLKRLDSWAKKAGKSRSRFIVEEMDKRLIELEDEEITQLYNLTSNDVIAGAKDRELAAEMLNISAVNEMGDR